MKSISKTNIVLTVVLFLTVTLIFAQTSPTNSPSTNFKTASANANTFIDDVVKWGVRSSYAFMYLLSIAKILPIFFSQQGEDKLSRAGWWLFLLAFAVVATIIAESLFNPTNTSA